MALSAAVGPPPGIIIGVTVAAGAAAGAAAFFFAKTTDVETARIAKPTRIFFITLKSSQVKRCDTTPRYLREPRFPSGSSPRREPPDAGSSARPGRRCVEYPTVAPKRLAGVGFGSKNRHRQQRRPCRPNGPCWHRSRQAPLRLDRVPVDGVRTDGQVLGDVVAVHLPLGNLTAGVLQQHVRLAVMVVVTGADHRPAGRRADRGV
jgi:hypothetical protein